MARYAPGSKPVPFAVNVICPGPMPEYCEAVSQEAVRLVGKMVAVHGCVLSEILTAIVACAAWVPRVGVAEILAGVAGGPPKETVTCSGYPPTSTSMTFSAGGVIPPKQ